MSLVGRTRVLPVRSSRDYFRSRRLYGAQVSRWAGLAERRLPSAGIPENPAHSRSYAHFGRVRRNGVLEFPESNDSCTP